jgi:hypothetical protein
MGWDMGIWDQRAKEKANEKMKKGGRRMICEKGASLVLKFIPTRI